ncbi:hypothetical protein SAMN02746073_2381 [Legionella jamestowniensis DSM 19215]|uniref:hypothetical protein n=1 Tax=Legionella jamestowniensis TaxID=455 RepID=UPI0008F1B406|nr:hypothetical protein [Legionella jamestowniensis]SFL88126.1 hypothetical protein SAMN02746073_2381 [Legionella jamestowniensis DSM 19215]
MPKILVVNGHGAKTGQKVQVNAQHGVITPGNAENSYVVSFDNQYRHLEEMTSQNKIWPLVDGQKNPVQWHRYRNTSIDEIQISPLQDQFSFPYFANMVLRKQTKWENLTTPSHDVMQRGALAVKMPNGLTEILEGKPLEDYLRAAAKGAHEGRPLFFCDKELGKIKPMGRTSLSEIYTALHRIEEFKNTDTEMIVATCSPAHSKGVQQIQVQTKFPPTEFATTAFVDIHAPQSHLTSTSELEIAEEIPAGMNMPYDNVPAGIDVLDTPAGVNVSFGASIPADVDNVSYEADIPAGADVYYSEDTSEKCNSLKSQLQSIKDTKSNLSPTELKSIRDHIEALIKEKKSPWCINKDLKQVKIDALEQLITDAQTMSVKEAVEKIKNDYPQIMHGKISTRTVDLLNSLAESDSNLLESQQDMQF